MSAILLDTNIVSELIKTSPSDHLLKWMMDQVDTDLFIASLTLAEIERGILQIPAGRKRSDLEKWFASPQGPPVLFQGRVLPFDDVAAPFWARLMAEGRRLGRPRNAADMIIAATALANNCVIATANERDFFDLPIVNPTKLNP